jgi:hypothetical protein
MTDLVKGPGQFSTCPAAFVAGLFQVSTWWNLPGVMELLEYNRERIPAHHKTAQQEEPHSTSE